MAFKPRITPWNGFYRCDGCGVAGFGITGASAYWQWLAMLPRPPIKRPGIKFVAELPRDSKPEDDRLALLLAAWQPGQQQAH